MTTERELPAVMDVEQVAAMLDCTPRTVEDNARDGTLPALKFGVSWVFPTAALLSRLSELALKQAHARREPPRAGAVIRAIPASDSTKSGRRRRPLPTLPSLPVAQP